MVLLDEGRRANQKHRAQTKRNEGVFFYREDCSSHAVGVTHGHGPLSALAQVTAKLKAASWHRPWPGAGSPIVPHVAKMRVF